MTTYITADIEDQHTQRKMTKYQIGLDVDGTLVDHYGHMSDRVRQATQALVAEGHHVQIATGRSLHATLPIIQQIGVTKGHAVVCNGAVIIELDPELPEGYQIIERHSFHPRQALQKLREELPTAKYAVEAVDGNFYSTERFQDPSFGVRAIGVSFEDMLDVEAVRLVVFSTDSTAEDFAETVKYLGLAGVTYSVGWTAWLDIAAAGISKASGLESLRKLIDVPQENTLTMGDGRNDIEMLGWAGHGVAMGQAPPEVVAVADEVTAHVNEDGAALVLERLLSGAHPVK